MERGQSREQIKVWVNGTFDVLHRGHIELIKYASKFGTVRVGLDYDERVRLLKGNTRPVNRWQDRVFLIESLVYVDSVVGFGTQEELENQIKEWNPTYLVVGADYKDKPVIGSQYCEQVIFFDKLDGYSSTNIINHGQNSSSW